jgi:phosphate transport system substrate-binding protein
MKKNLFNVGIIPVIIVALAFSFVACNEDGQQKTSDTVEHTIIGAGSSFDNPLFSRMFYEYHKNTQLQINYQSVGSGAGISQLSHKTVDFGASDAPMNAAQEQAAGSEILHVPVTAGAVVISYNLAGIKVALKFTPAVLSDIFLGNITKWDDAQIAVVNPGVKLPSMAIVVAHRSDGSGTSSIFTSYLSKVSSEWESKVGTGTSVNWPVGLGGKGNEGVSGLIRQTPGAIGYIELAYAIQNQMPYAQIKNKAGHFIVPGIESVTAAANIEIPADGKISLTNTEAVEGYPISGFSWVLIYKEQGYDNRSQAEAEQLLTLLNWMIHEGQQYSAALDYAPLSQAAVARGEAILKSATFKGQVILK